MNHITGQRTRRRKAIPNCCQLLPLDVRSWKQETASQANTHREQRVVSGRAPIVYIAASPGERAIEWREGVLPAPETSVKSVFASHTIVNERGSGRRKCRQQVQRHGRVARQKDR